MKNLKTILGASMLMMCVGHSAFSQRTISGQITLNPCIFPMDQDDFSNATPWSQIDPITTGNGRIIVNTTQNNILITPNEASGSGCMAPGQAGACSNREMRIYRPLTGTVSNTSWRTEFVINISTGNAPNYGLIGLTSGTQDPEGNYSPSSAWACNSGSANSGVWSATSQDGIFASLVAFGTNQIPNSFSSQPFTPANQTAAANATSTSGWCIYGHAKKAGGSFYPASSPFNSSQLNWSWGIPLPALKTNYFIRLERLSANTCMISVFSDAARTIHIPMSPQCFQIDPNIQGLSNVQSFQHQSGSFMRSLTGVISDLNIFNNCPGIPTLTLTASSPSVTCSANTVTLTATPGFSTYTWNPGNITTTSNTLAVSPGSTTQYSVTAVYNAVAYPCFHPTASVQVGGMPNYLTFSPLFAITSGLPPASQSFSVEVTPVAGSTNLDISTARTNTGYNYGYLWKVETLDPANNNNVLCSVINPSNWWNNASTNDFPGYSSNSSGGCSDNTSITTGAGVFDISHKYRITRGVWNPCAYTEATVAVSYCTNCRTSNGGPSLVIEQGPVTRSERVPVTEVSPQKTQSTVMIAPNPNNGEFNILVENNRTEYTYEVYDSYGALLLQNTSAEEKQAVSIHDSKPGVYILKVNLAGEVYIKRVIKE
ncbi:MAG: T9SS type A sorting domain-containing protein [Bacteroidetes bacterium]|nr:T9SS type A sorting domain-containing protein [Bacteroidota bacterium]